jgi:SAM-dependent methyltransferase
MSPIHERAATGFERAGEDYERGRPGYPPAAVAALIDEFGPGRGRVVVDLAAGTGKLTRSLLPTGAQVLAVEPVPGMRGYLAQTAPGARALAGTAEQIPLTDGSVDLVTVAQAFHWFDTGAAAREIHRVLKRDGGLAVLWNSWDESVRWVEAMQAIVHEFVAGAPQQASSDWRQRLQDTALFTPLHERTYPNLVAGDVAAVLARVASTSYIAALPAVEHQRVLDRVRAVIDSDPLTAGRERIDMPYDTHVVWGRRREIAPCGA